MLKYAILLLLPLAPSPLNTEQDCLAGLWSNTGADFAGPYAYLGDVLEWNIGTITGGSCDEPDFCDAEGYIKFEFYDSPDYLVAESLGGSLVDLGAPGSRRQFEIDWDLITPCGSNKEGRIEVGKWNPITQQYEQAAYINVILTCSDCAEPV